MRQIFRIATLSPGQEVAIANCRETGRVVTRVAKNLYLVRYQGQDIEMSRRVLGVRKSNQWCFGPASTDETGEQPQGDQP